MLRWLRSDAIGWLCASVALFVVSLLLREDSIGVAPVLVVLAALAARQAGVLRERRRQLAGYAAALALASLASLLARQILLTPQTDSPWTEPVPLVAHFVEIVTLAGWHPYLLLFFFGAIFVLLVLAAARLKGEDAETAWAWLVCSALSATPGIVETRVNLLFFPTTFYCLFAAQVLTTYAIGRERHFRIWTPAVATAIAVICVLVPARESRLQQLSMAPGSAGNVETDCDIARGGEWAVVASPKRRDDALRELTQLGLDARSCEAVIDASGWHVRTGCRLTHSCRRTGSFRDNACAACHGVLSRDRLFVRHARLSRLSIRYRAIHRLRQNAAGERVPDAGPVRRRVLLLQPERRLPSALHAGAAGRTTAPREQMFNERYPFRDVRAHGCPLRRPRA